MRRKINPILQALLVVYHSLVFLPLGILITLICSAIIIIMLPIAGNAKWGSYPAMFWARALCAISLVRVKVEGQEHLDPKASYIFVANHQSLYDIPLVYGWLKNNFKWIIKKEFRKMPVMGYLCYRMGHIFIDRSNPMRAKQSLDQAKQNLKKGNTSIFLFPEGTRTRNGQVGRFKRGAFTIARDLHLPIVPVSIIGAYEALPKGLNCIIPGKIKIIFHQPIDTTHLTDDNLSEMVDNVREIVTKDVKTKRK
jgi:1-acyl-sn-glycerol-3-phosphate acyltransferase